MFIPEHWDRNYDKKISNVEYEVLEKFFTLYRNQNIIVADEFKEEFGGVPLKDGKIIFKSIERVYKSMNFCRKIYHNGKLYVVELGLWRVGHVEPDLEGLKVKHFKIITNGKVHFIDLNPRSSSKNEILSSISSIFDERKIISPEQAYSNRIYTDKDLQRYIKWRDWGSIAQGVNQKPSLANALFIIRDIEGTDSHFTANFGTILYHVVLFRMNHSGNISESDLRGLDRLILKLSKAELLKVTLHQQIGGSASWTDNSILLESSMSCSRMHSSQQCNVHNTELSDEYGVLKKCIMSNKSKNKK